MIAKNIVVLSLIALTQSKPVYLNDRDHDGRSFYNPGIIRQGYLHSNRQTSNYWPIVPAKSVTLQSAYYPTSQKSISWHFGTLYDTSRDIGSVHAGPGVRKNYDDFNSFGYTEPFLNSVNQATTTTPRYLEDISNSKYPIDMNGARNKFIQTNVNTDKSFVDLQPFNQNDLSNKFSDNFFQKNNAVKNIQFNEHGSSQTIPSHNSYVPVRFFNKFSNNVNNYVHLKNDITNKKVHNIQHLNSVFRTSTKALTDNSDLVTAKSFVTKDNGLYRGISANANFESANTESTLNSQKASSAKSSGTIALNNDAKVNAEVHGHGLAKAIANTDSEPPVSTPLKDKSLYKQFVEAKTDITNNVSSAKSFVLNHKQGGANAKSEVNGNGSGLAQSSVDANGSAKATAKVNKVNSVKSYHSKNAPRIANAVAEIKSAYNLQREAHIENSTSQENGLRYVKAFANTDGHETAESYARTQGFGYGTLDSKSVINESGESQATFSVNPHRYYRVYDNIEYLKKSGPQAVANAQVIGRGSASSYVNTGNDFIRSRNENNPNVGHASAEAKIDS